MIACTKQHTVKRAQKKEGIPSATPAEYNRWSIYTGRVKVFRGLAEHGGEWRVWTRRRRQMLSKYGRNAVRAIGDPCSVGREMCVGTGHG